MPFLRGLQMNCERTLSFLFEKKFSLIFPKGSKAFNHPIDPNDPDIVRKILIRSYRKKRRVNLSIEAIFWNFIHQDLSNVNESTLCTFSSKKISLLEPKDGIFVAIEFLYKFWQQDLHDVKWIKSIHLLSQFHQLKSFSTNFNGIIFFSTIFPFKFLSYRLGINFVKRIHDLVCYVVVNSLWKICIHSMRTKTVPSKHTKRSMKFTTNFSNLSECHSLKVNTNRSHIHLNCIQFDRKVLEIIAFIL